MQKRNKLFKKKIPSTFIFQKYNVDTPKHLTILRHNFETRINQLSFSKLFFFLIICHKNLQLKAKRLALAP